MLRAACGRLRRESLLSSIRSVVSTPVAGRTCSCSTGRGSRKLRHRPLPPAALSELWIELGFREVKPHNHLTTFILKIQAFFIRILLSTIILVIEYIFIINLFKDMDANNIYYKFDQT